MCRYAFAHSPLSLKRSDMLALPGSPSVASTVLLLSLAGVYDMQSY